MSGKRPRSSPAWNYFYEIDKSTMVCCMCNDHIRIGNGSTSNLLIHLRVKHKDVKISDNDTGVEYVQQNTRRQVKKIKPIQKMKIGKNTYQVPLIAAVNDDHEYHNQHQLASQCYSYAGGHVYPQEAGGSKGHTLHWSKAQISKPAPDFEGTAVVNGEFKELKLSQFKGKYLVFFFYPLDFTFVCPTEIIAFSDRINEFRAINTEVVACSVDSSFTHLAWIKTPRKEGGLGPLNIPLLSDLTHQISKDYGVYLEDLGHTLRGLFIIDSKGILRQMTLNDLPVGRSVDETLRLVQAFQYTDQHGEVCPAGWKPGGETIIPNPEEKLKYFSRFNDIETS